MNVRPTGRRPDARPGPDPLVGVDRLLVDGTNLLYRLGRERGRGPEPEAPAALVGRLRAVIPAQTRIELVFDGAPEHGLAGVRIAHGLTVRHSGWVSADALLDRLVADAAGSGGTAADAVQAAGRLLVVTDDRALGDELRRRGARVAGAAWLIGRLARTRLSAPSAGAPRSPEDGPAEDEADRPGWRPGRGATTKT
ncbi:MAG: hypothetical protein ACRDGQ_07840, partial [Candidatus Limnocylindrales bacterium]